MTARASHFGLLAPPERSRDEEEVARSRYSLRFNTCLDDAIALLVETYIPLLDLESQIRHSSRLSTVNPQCPFLCP